MPVAVVELEVVLELLAVVLELPAVVLELLAVVLERLAIVLELLVDEPLEPQAASNSEQATTPSNFAGM